MEPRQLLSTFVVTNTNDDTNPNSLRWAILQANSSQAASEIQFGIARSGSVKIQLSSPLPALDVPVSIDGTTEPGYVGSPLVEIDGVGLSGGGDDGLVIMAGGSTIRGLSLVGFSGSAIVLNTGSEDAIADNYLGIDPTGAVAIPNQQGITLLGSSGNTIGAGPAGIGNVISGNSGDGILIETGDTGSVANLIDGNRIGTTADGSNALGNHGAGIAIAGADDNIIGAVGPGFGNVIGGNAGPGISVTGGAAGTAIQNNFLGVAADGATPLGNQGDGIQLDDAPGTLIGGASPGEGNIISENQQNGIDTAGDTAGLWVAGNEIGTDLTGQLKLGNYQSGINLASSSNLIGGTVAGAANVIEFNGTGRVGAGVQLVGLVGQNTILSNSIYQNAGLGINFGSGPTPNHAPDTAGPNNYQNYPTLSSAQSDGSVTTVTGTLYESPDSSYLIQFFSSPRPDLSGYGQGKVLIGSTSAQTNAQGIATFTAGLSLVTQSGAYVSATATDASGDTSEFSANLAIQGQDNLSLTGTATPDPVLAGGTLTYTLTVANQGVADAEGVILNDQLPAGVSLVSVNTTQGFIVPQMGGGSITVALGTIPAGSTATVTIQAQTAAGTTGTIVEQGDGLQPGDRRQIPARP